MRAAGLLASTIILASGTPASAAPAPPPLHQGWIVTTADPTRCLTGGVIGTLIHSEPCDRGTAGQLWYQSSDGHLTGDGNCMQAGTAKRGARVRVAACTWEANQAWTFGTTLSNGDDGPCLTEEMVNSAGYGTIRLRPCNGTVAQNWKPISLW
ncbi:RICIN domain-containing protein [Actinoplanes sp. NPDC051851]|uniref:RICIN domain-containing protein n=1 Tax=Actinoplanes sp. NPDC051851 TaxID=3154753 RepID=UPI00343DDDFA